VSLAKAGINFDHVGGGPMDRPARSPRRLRFPRISIRLLSRLLVTHLPISIGLRSRFSGSTSHQVIRVDRHITLATHVIRDTAILHFVLHHLVLLGLVGKRFLQLS
jgi:hypothetical protein